MIGDYTIVTYCARCGGTHKRLKLRRFGREPGKWTHWVMCPKAHEPILVRYTDDPLPTGSKWQGIVVSRKRKKR